MESAGDNQREKNDVVKKDTFPVSFALEEIKKNITITTNSASKKSKEQIIKQAFKFHLQGNIQEAEKLYQNFIHRGFIDH